jgi:lycopene cyclase domain-containing protein
MFGHYTYAAIMLGSLIGPLALSFDKKVAFYKTWPAVFKAMLLPALVYIIWDAFFTHKGVWQFNPQYITGIKIFNLPIEEVAFFFIVPYCCTFVYACIKAYFPKIPKTAFVTIVFWMLVVALLVFGLLHINKYYTSYTFLLNAVLLSVWLLGKKYFSNTNTTTFGIAYLVILIPFLIVNGFLTAIPVVIYNNTENLGFRITTIPFEDIFYGLILVLANILTYDKLLAIKNTNTNLGGGA